MGISVRCNLISFAFLFLRFHDAFLRLVDRGDYVPEPKRAEAYKDAAYRTSLSPTDEANSPHLHLSAPSIYSSAIEQLDIQPGHAFLNIGSGTGYINTVVGYLLSKFFVIIHLDFREEKSSAHLQLQQVQTMASK